MIDRTALERAVSLWQLCQVQSYLQENGDFRHAKSIKKAVRRLVELFADEVGEQALTDAMEVVDAYSELPDANGESDGQNERAIH